MYIQGCTAHLPIDRSAMHLQRPHERSCESDHNRKFGTIRSRIGAQYREYETESIGTIHIHRRTDSLTRTIPGRSKSASAFSDLRTSKNIDQSTKRATGTPGAAPTRPMRVEAEALKSYAPTRNCTRNLPGTGCRSTARFDPLTVLMSVQE